MPLIHENGIHQRSVVVRLVSGLGNVQTRLVMPPVILNVPRARRRKNVCHRQMLYELALCVLGQTYVDLGKLQDHDWPHLKGS